MSSLFINRNCIACDACREVCPTSAISVQDPTYSIDTDTCILCNGYSPMPQCIQVCPVDAILFRVYDKKDSVKRDSRILC